MLGLVPGSIPSSRLLPWPSESDSHRPPPPLAWNAISNFPVVSSTMLGLVPGAIPRYSLIATVGKVVRQRPEPPYAWNAADREVTAQLSEVLPPMLGLVFPSIPA